LDKSQIRVLALDDEPFMLKLLAHLLHDLGFQQVTTCDNGAAALQALGPDGQAMDLVLLDLNMPDMDGVEFVRELVGRGYGGSLILVSGEDERVLHMAEKLVQAHQVNVLGHLSKPFTLAGLSALMEKSMVSVRRRARAASKSYAPEQLEAAITGGELVNYYQPKVAVATGIVVGVETLARWRHPQDGLVFPDQFIGLAEEHGLIDALTRAVTRNALAQVRTWLEIGLHLRVAINISMDNLSSIAFAEFIADEALAAGIPPQDIILEVTESRLMLDERAPLEILTRLRMKRYRLSIDDFGTGHSSLKLLHDISFDELKIDRSFVHEAWRDPTTRAIYDASLALGKQLGMVVVAEGVEDAEDWSLVKRTGCDLAQGYFIARPMPAAELPGWVESWNARMQRGGDP
jgi:EAL domain-containing protein (putative c-di-GMP-specific phosphodiesterase class I)/DNA-binding NarL/FixJ family response regulator